MNSRNIQLHLPAFLKKGALLRTPEGRLFVWQGDKSQEKTSIKTIGYSDFFGAYQDLDWDPGEALEIPISEFRQAISEAAQGNPLFLSKNQFSTLHRGHFEASFREIQRRLQRGEIEKAVAGLFVESPKKLTSELLLSHLSALLETQQAVFIYGCWNEKGGVLGASPEILFHQKSGIIRTMALAGTRPANGNDRLSLLRDSKELREHDLVIQDIKQRLEKFGPVHVGNTEEVSYQTLFHLRTFLEVRSAFVESKELVKNLHPTPALGVSPRNYGVKWMRELPEQADRGLYGGPVCFQISPTESIGVVAIRSMFWDENRIRIGVGCGLVEASELDREWDELHVKLNSIYKFMGVN